MTRRSSFAMRIGQHHVYIGCRPGGHKPMFVYSHFRSENIPLAVRILGYGMVVAGPFPFIHFQNTNKPCDC